MLGVNSYAVREGAKYRDEKSKLNIFTQEIFTINILSTILSYILLGILLLFSVKMKDYIALIALQSISIILTAIGVEWINVIFEDYLLITIRSIATHVVSFVLLFVFVRKPEDYYFYAFLSVLTSGIICVTNLIHCRKYVKIRLTKHPKIKEHLKPLLILFANSVAISIYVNFDNTMVGWIKGDYYVGLYTVSVKIYTIVKTLMAAVYSVSLSRLSYYIGNNDIAAYRKLYTSIWGYLSIILIPAGAGLAALSPEVMLFMGGEELLEAEFSLKILSFALIFAIFGGLVTACLNVPIKREKDNLTATIISAAINCGLNFVFIPFWSHNGAALTTLISEAFVFIFCIVRIKNIKDYLDIKSVLPSIIHASIGGAVIIIFSIVIHLFLSQNILTFAIIGFGSIILYVIVLALFRDKYFVLGKRIVLSRVSSVFKSRKS